MKALLTVLSALVLASAEPPVPSSQYLPSSLSAPSGQYGAPSSQYGAPSSRSSFSRPSSTYGAPSYQAQTTAVIKPKSLYGAPSSAPQYSAPAPSSQYGAPSAPSSQYGAPSQQYSAPSTQYGAPSAPSSQYGAPSSLYGAPGGGYAGGRSGYDDQSEPANYNFEYHVEDAASGNDFGHQESRQGDVAQGKYFVLLPDGRRQVVEYTADTEGYKPRISYEQVGGGYAGGGYSGGGYSGGGNGGYQY